MTSIDDVEIDLGKAQYIELQKCLKYVKNLPESQFNKRLKNFTLSYVKAYPELSYPFFVSLINEFNKINSEYHGSTVIDLLSSPHIRSYDIIPIMYIGVTGLWNDFVIDKYEEFRKKKLNLSEIETKYKEWLLWYFIKID